MAHSDSAGGAGVVAHTLLTLGMCGVQPAGARGESEDSTKGIHDGDGLHRPEDGATPSIDISNPEEEPALEATEGVLVGAEDAPGVGEEGLQPLPVPGAVVALHRCPLLPQGRNHLLAPPLIT